MTRASPTDLARAALYVRAVSTAELHLPPVTLAPSDGRRHRSALAPAAWMLVAASLPLVGLVSLLLREQLDPWWSITASTSSRSWRSASGSSYSPPRPAPRRTAAATPEFC